MTALAIDPPPVVRRSAWPDAAALVIAIIGHVVAFVLLSASFLAKPDLVQVNEQPMDVVLTDKIGLEATAPQSVTPPAQSVAPEQGAPQDAAPPAPATPAAAPAPLAPAKPAPSARDADKPQPVTKARPAPESPRKATKPAAAAPSLPNPSTFKADNPGKSGSKAHAKGATLGDDFLNGLSDKPSKSHSQTPRAAIIDAAALASIRDAIARQIQPCADRQVNPGPGANRIVTTLNLRLNPDGTLAGTPSVVRQAGVDDENERYAQRVKDLGIAAFKGCSPLRLPPEFYATPNGGWGNINYNWQLR